MKSAFGINGKTSNIARILGNFRSNQYDLKKRIKLIFWFLHHFFNVVQHTSIPFSRFR